MNKVNSKFKVISILLIILFGSFLRGYNINYNDFWSDEMVSFWVSDPSLSFDETLQRIFSSQWMVLNEILLKYFHSIFGYDVNISRYFSFFISVLSLISFALLLSNISNINSTIFGIFILSINIYHIGYSIELRSYILTFFLVNLFIYIAFINSKSKIISENLKTVFLCILSILLLFNHVFTLIVLGSYIFFIFVKYFINKKITKNEILLVISLITTILLFFIIYFNTTMKIIDPGVFKGISPEWMWQVKPSFYTNYYFSKFFGSRFLGLVYLLTLIICFIKFKKDIFKNFNIYLFFIFLIFFTYFIPLLFGYIFSPILIDRYIFYVLIPILCLISHYIFKIENQILKIFLIILITFPTLLNNFLFENSFKQLYTKVNTTKPEVKKTLKLIEKSNIKTFSFKRDDRYAINTNLVIENYLIKSAEKLNLNLDYLPFNSRDIKLSKFWIIYLKDTTSSNFIIPKNFSSFRMTQEYQLNRISLHLLER